MRLGTGRGNTLQKYRRPTWCLNEYANDVIDLQTTKIKFQYRQWRRGREAGAP